MAAQVTGTQEARAREDYARVAGRVVFSRSITAYCGDDSEEYYDPNVPYAVRVDTGLPDSYITHAVDEWVDPYWNCTPVGDDPRLAGTSGWWIYGTSYSTSGEVDHGSLVLGPDGQPLVIAVHEKRTEV